MQESIQVPGPKGHFLLGSLLKFKRDSLRCMCDWHKDYGDLVHFKLGPKDFYLISHPDLVEQALIQQKDIFVKMYDAGRPNGLSLVLGNGLVTSQGALWKKQRRLIQPVFYRGNVAKMLPQILSAGIDMLARWDELPTNAEINIADEMMRMTLEVITQTMFSTSVLSQIDQIGPALETALRYAVKTIQNPLTLPLSLPTRTNREFKRAMAILDNVIYGIIEQRRSSGKKEGDLLDMLLAAKDPDTGKIMSDQQLRDEVLTIFSAGHETTATTLTWTLYLLAKNPEILADLHRELSIVLDGRLPDEKSLSNLPYTKAILDESMRIRPSVVAVMRKIEQDTELGGFPLSAGGMAILSIYNIHHHPDLWSQPEIFNPDRFLNNARPRYSFIPFGLGHRACVGNHFAMFESQLLLALIAQLYNFSLVNAKPPEIEMTVTLKPKGGIPMIISRR